MITLLIIYNLLVTTVFLLTTLTTTRPNYLLALLFLPLVLHFLLELFIRADALLTKKIIRLHRQSASPTPILIPIDTSASSSAPTTITQPPPSATPDRDQTLILEPEVVPALANVSDPNRRMFLKAIGSAGLGLFFMAIFTKKAQAAFFGSIPGPGTVAIKDSQGNLVDPAKNHPTDGYKLAELDEAASYTYYGFVDKDGNWYITRESSTGAYRYVRGAALFADNWATRATRNDYDTFDATF